MKFRRRRVGPFDTDRLRALGARAGWLIETPEVLTVGFGRPVQRIALPEGLGASRVTSSRLAQHELTGDNGPPGSGVTAFAALPFDRLRRGELHVVQYTITQWRNGDAWVTVADGARDPSEMVANTPVPSQGVQVLQTVHYQPSPEEYAHHVAQAVEYLRRKEIDKVVLARAVVGSVKEPIDPAAVAQRLRQREPLCTIYAMPTADNRRFVGATPELLVQRRGHTIICHPLAGTTALPNEAGSHDYETWLLGSAKNLHEHAVVVDDIVRTLSAWCDDINADGEPSIVTLATVAHLGSWIRARVTGDGEGPDALDFLRLLHPTAAVGGIPRDGADALIHLLEQHDRGHFAGPVGWVDSDGDGEWWVALRGVLLEDQRFEAWAGAGIVSESDPVAEREETRNKLAVVLSSILSEPI